MSKTVTIEDLAAALNATASGDEFSAHCPAHHDSRPSLSFREDEDTGRILMKCHAGCSYEDLVEALKKRGILLPSGKNKPQSFVYHDATGQPLYRVRKTQNKSFWVERFEKGAYLRGFGSVKQVLYRLPQILAASQDMPVYVAEGEKDAESVAALGLVATTNFGGADVNKWNDSFTAVLAGKDIILLEDNDTAGKERCQKLSALLRPDVKSVRIIDFRELDTKGADVSDWIEQRRSQGKSDEQIRKELSSRALNRQNTCLSLAEIVEKNAALAQIDWLLKDTLPCSQPFALVGDGGTGKSTIAMALGKLRMMLRESTGLSRGKVVYLALEGNLQNIINIAQAVQIDLQDVLIIQDSSGNMTLDLGIDAVRSFVVRQILEYEEEYGVAMVIVDSFGSMSRTIDLNSPRVATLMHDLNAVLEKPGIPIAYINHRAKAENSLRSSVVGMGSVQFGANVRTLFLVEKCKDSLIGWNRMQLKKSNYVGPSEEKDYYYLVPGVLPVPNSGVHFVSAEDMFGCRTSEENGETAPRARDKAIKMVIKIFVESPDEEIDSKIFQEAASKESISDRALKEAFATLKVKSKKNGLEQLSKIWLERRLYVTAPPTGIPTLPAIEPVTAHSTVIIPSPAAEPRMPPVAVPIDVIDSPSEEDKQRAEVAGLKIYHAFNLDIQSDEGLGNPLIFCIRLDGHMRNIRLLGYEADAYREIRQYENLSLGWHYHRSGDVIHVLLMENVPVRASFTDCLCVWPRLQQK